MHLFQCYFLHIQRVKMDYCRYERNKSEANGNRQIQMKHLSWSLAETKRKIFCRRKHMEVFCALPRWMKNNLKRIVKLFLDS